jgi:hypothetical protein
MISGTSFISTPPIPGNVQRQAPAGAPPEAEGTQQSAQTAQPPAQAPQQAPQPSAPPSQPPAAAAPAPPNAPPATYWAANGKSYATLPEIGQAVAAGQIPSNNGTVNVQKIGLTDSNAQKAMHKASAMRFFKASLITGFGGMFAGALLGPLGGLATMASSALSMWNGYKAFQEYQKAGQDHPTQYTVIEEGRIKPGMGQFNYEAVDNNSVWNIVPSHPFAYKPGVPLHQVQ